MGLNFNKKITAGVYSAVIENNSKYASIQNVGCFPEAVFNMLHKNHDAGGVSGNFLLYKKDGDYEICTLTSAEERIAKYAL